MADKSIYLIAKYTGVPKDPTQTFKPGYMKNPENIHYDEQVYVTRGIREKDRRNQVILNLTEEKIVKNTFNPGLNFEEVLTHYFNGYGEHISDSINQLTM